MTDFYVYQITTDAAKKKRSLVFVEDLSKFARQIYNPSKMEFTGVMVQAPDLETAAVVYNNPASVDGDYHFVEEPKLTASKANLANAIKGMHDVVLQAAVVGLNRQSTLLNKTLGVIAKQIWERSNKMLTVEEIYEKLKEQVANNIKGWKIDGGS